MVLPRQSILLANSINQNPQEINAPDNSNNKLNELRAKKLSLIASYDKAAEGVTGSTLNNINEKRAASLSLVDRDIRAAERAERTGETFVQAKKAINKGNTAREIAGLSNDKREAYNKQREEVKARVTVAKANNSATAKYVSAEQLSAAKTITSAADKRNKEASIKASTKPTIIITAGGSGRNAEAIAKYRNTFVSSAQATPLFTSFSQAPARSSSQEPIYSPLEPNTSTEGGAVYSPPPASYNASGGTSRGLKGNSLAIAKGFFSTQGAEPYTLKQIDKKGIKINFVESSDYYYTAGQAADIAVTATGAGLAAKGVKFGLSALTKAPVIKTVYNKFPTMTTLIGGGAVVTEASQRITSGYGKLKEKGRNYFLLKDTPLTSQEFSGFITNATQESQKEGFLNSAGFQLSTRFGSDENTFNETFLKRLEEKNITGTQAAGLLTSAQRTKGSRERIEFAGLVATSAGVENIGRRTIKGGLSYAASVFNKPLTRAGATGVTTTISGGTTATLGFYEGFQQTKIQQDLRGTGRSYGQAAKFGVAGSVTAGVLGGIIGGAAASGSKSLSKGVLTTAYILDTTEPLGDITEDVFSPLLRVEAPSPTITVTGTLSKPTYSFSPNIESPAPVRRGRTNVNSIPASYDALPQTSSFGSFAPTISFSPTVPTPSAASVPNSPLIPNSPAVPSSSSVPSSPVIPVPSSPSVPTTTGVPTTPTVPTTVGVPTTASVPTTVGVPVITPLPRFPLAPLVVGGGFSLGSLFSEGKKQKTRYTPSAYSLLTGLTGSRPSKLAIKTGFSVRPITKSSKKKGKKKGDIDELLSFTRTYGRKRKRKSFGTF